MRDSQQNEKTVYPLKFITPDNCQRLISKALPTTQIFAAKWTTGPGLSIPMGNFQTENPPLTASSYGWRMGLVLLENGFPNGPFPNVSLSNALPRVTPSFSRFWQEKGDYREHGLLI